MRALFLWCTLVATSAWAGVRQGTTVEVARGETIAEDLYVAGGTVAIDGVVDGDLIVVAGDLRVAGEVKGDVLWLGGRGKLDGKIGGSVRGLGGQLAIEGPVRDDLAFAGGELTLARFGAIGRDLLLGAGRGQLLGRVGRDARIGAGLVDVDGLVGGRVEGQIGQLALGESTRIAGDLKVATDNEIRRAPGAQVAGSFEKLPLPEPARSGAGVGFIGWLRRLLSLLAVAALWLVLFPGFSRRAMATLRTRPRESFGFGVFTLLAAPLVAVGVFAVGVLLGGWWLSAVAMGVLLVSAAIAAPLVGHFVGEWVLRLFKREGTEAARQGIGLVILTLLAAIPVLGPLVVLATACAGVGAQVLALRGRLPVQTSERLDTLRDPIPQGPEEVGSPS